MKKQEELFTLFNEGKSIDECIKMGYKRATVYRWFLEWRKEKEKERLKALIDESELIKKVFSALKNGWELRRVVSEYGVSPKKVIELYEDYIKLAEIETGLKEKIDRINEISNRIDVLNDEKRRLEEENEKLKLIQNELQKRIDEMRKLSYKNFIELLKSRKRDLEWDIANLSLEMDFFGKSEQKMKEKEELVRELKQIEDYLKERGEF